MNPPSLNSVLTIWIVGDADAHRALPGTLKCLILDVGMKNKLSRGQEDYYLKEAATYSDDDNDAGQAAGRLYRKGKKLAHSRNSCDLP